jgi:alpha-L-rhamnosidase
VAVEGYPAPLNLDHFTAIALHSDLAPTGGFECDHPLLNQLQHNIVWGQKGNFVDVPTDCPQRDERLGWTGDAQVFVRTAAFNMHVAGFFTKWLRDLAADQFPDGKVPHVIPDIVGEGGSTGWGDAAVIGPWTLYQAYGDTRILAEQYPSMAAWVGFMRQQANGFLWNSGKHYGDWLAVTAPDANNPNPVTNKYLIATAFFAHSTDLLAQTARVLGKDAEAAEHERWLAQIKDAFCQEFVTPNGRLVSDTQTAYVLALHFDLLPPALRPQAARRLVEDIRARDHHLSTGFLGTPYLCHVLSQHGYLDTAYALLEQETFPSWLYPITQGATTIWERWDSLRPDGTFQDPGMNSFNHYAYGAIGDWLYRVVAGLDLAAPGYQRSLIRPQPGGHLNQARAWHLTPYGRFESGWTREEGRLTFSLTIPPNTEAEVHLPAQSIDQISEAGQPLTVIAGLRHLRDEPGHLVVTLGSGTYTFDVRLPA